MQEIADYGQLGPPSHPKPLHCTGCVDVAVCLLMPRLSVVAHNYILLKPSTLSFIIDLYSAKEHNYAVARYNYKILSSTVVTYSVSMMDIGYRKRSKSVEPVALIHYSETKSRLNIAGLV